MKVIVIFLIIFILIVKCDDKKLLKNSKLRPLLHFRSKVEETEDLNVNKKEHDGSRSNLVAFLVKNVREIFNELSDNNKSSEHQTKVKTHTPEIIENDTTETTEYPETIKTTKFTKSEPVTFENDEITRTTLKLTNDVMLYENISITNLMNDDKAVEYTKEVFEDITKDDKKSKRLSKELMYLKTLETPVKEHLPAAFYKLVETNKVEIPSESNESMERRRSCIVCDNVNSEDCNDPKNKLISSGLCEYEDDLCYSLHTPFGIVDRGCYNVNFNETTYVCSCNLCNSISISEMPYIFSNKRDWLDNVIEISRTRHFKKSVFKDMSCLRCEVNVTTKRADILDSANCLEGNIGSLPTEECDDDEICGVKVVRNDGYIWRGCVDTPLYNYWWALCDSDLCNYDPLISIYDYL